MTIMFFALMEIVLRIATNHNETFVLDEGELNCEEAEEN